MRTRGTRKLPLASPASRLGSMVLVLLALLAVSCGRAAAQHGPAPAARAVIVYTVSAVLASDSSGAAAQGARVQRLARDPRLASLTVERTDARAQARIVARFVFESEEEFARWTSGEDGRRAAEGLGGVEGTPSYQVEYRRLPLADLLRLTSPPGR